MSERTFDDFDDFATDYRSIHSANIKLSGADSFYFVQMKVQLLQQFEKNGAAKVLDIGCGDGATALFMQQYFPQWQIQGIDISSKSIEVATHRNLSNASFSVYNGTAISYADEIFDVIFIAGVLHHVTFSLHETIVKEIQRLLKKGGRLYLFEHNPLNPVTKYLVNTCVFDKDARLLKSSYTTKLLQQNKLAVAQKQFIIFFPRKGMFSKLIFLEKYLQWLPFGGQYFIKAIK
ncbi:MAG TPA: class I SAM-dependent methyltransferase [Ferruginibacter sp.]|jgi:ubiquinone/menaquinone biosynthesis C-methylase UbiE|nr:class I SAM-dependent methyltransferase [Ferruginibacter sp.]